MSHLINYSAHCKALPQLSGVEYVFLPTNVTSIYQPPDQGIWKKVKKLAQKSILLRIISNVDRHAELRALGAKQKNDMCGIACYPGHVLDTIRAMWHVFDNLTPKEVSKCWLESGLTSLKQAQEVCRMHLRKLSRSYSSTVGSAAWYPEEVALLKESECAQGFDGRSDEENVNEQLSLVDDICETNPSAIREGARNALP